MLCMHAATAYIQWGTLYMYNRCTVVLKICISYCGISLQENEWTDRHMFYQVPLSFVALPPGPIASFDSGYNVCTSLLLWVNVPNAYINTFWRSSASSSSREGRMCEKNPGTKNHH